MISPKHIGPDLAIIQPQFMPTPSIEIERTLSYAKKHVIRLSGPALGRPPSQIEKQKAAQKQARQDELDRIPIEGKFGQGKRRFSLAKIMSKLDNTSETVIAVVFLMMNLEKWLKSLFFICFYFFMSPIFQIQGACRTIKCQLEFRFGYLRNQIGFLSLLYLQKQIVQEALCRFSSIKILLDKQHRGQNNETIYFEQNSTKGVDMCGIAGLISFNQKERFEPVLNRMLASMHHRGPDATGIYCSDNAGLGHTRLSIIDLSGGYQPIHNEEKNLWVVFNGEIFNYPELTAQLKEKGHRFYTQSDTETIVHLYEEYGSGLFEHLNGQFAIAIWDHSRQQLLLGRDRMGIRPLFYHQKGRRFSFASEIKALLTDPAIGRRLNPKTLADVFTCWAPVDPLTAFEGIYQIPPAHYAVLNRDGLKLHRYWQLDFTETDDHDKSEEDWAGQMQALILDAARIRLRADVSVGAYLSGGIDSTYISTLVKNNFNNKLNTFSVGFTDKNFDESRFQQTALSAIQTQHHGIECSEDDIGKLFAQVVWHAETPTIRTAPAPLMMLSALVRKSDFKVVLTGEGADEIFAGYNIFKEAKIRRFWAKHPESAIRPQLLRKLYPYVFNKETGRSNAFLFGFFKKNLQDVDSPVYSHLIRWQNTSHLLGFFQKGFLPPESDLTAFTRRITDQLPEAFSQWPVLGQAQYLESTLFLSNYLLSTQGDRMSMANSVEGRYPFLDHRVVELAARIPSKLRLNGLNEKFLLKKIARGQVPDEVANRSKQPYRAPISRCFLHKNAPEYVSEMLSGQAVKKAGYFDYQRIKRLVDKCRQKDGMLASERENMALVAILSTQLLDHQFIQSFPVYSGEPMDHTVVENQTK
ncbi:MAG: asparagine synthase (glutamine-hydrolyzing) [Desulfobacteraceae bacterium]|nr:asparagine synthase (glutamine-hydrolyzing) [Desulfobacteraceae bacterium]